MDQHARLALLEEQEITTIETDVVCPRPDPTIIAPARPEDVPGRSIPSDVPMVDMALSDLESIISRGKQFYIEMGLALRAIRDRRKYRDAGFTDFDEYCRARQQMSRRHADRIIKAAEVGLVLRPFGLTPENEAQARAWGPFIAEMTGKYSDGLSPSIVREALRRYEYAGTGRRRSRLGRRPRCWCRRLRSVEPGTAAEAIAVAITYLGIARGLNSNPKLHYRLLTEERRLKAILPAA